MSKKLIPDPVEIGSLTVPLMEDCGLSLKASQFKLTDEQGRVFEVCITIPGTVICIQLLDEGQHGHAAWTFNIAELAEAAVNQIRERLDAPVPEEAKA